MASKIKDLLNAYELIVRGIDHDAHENTERSYGGIVRAGKGILVESLAKNIVEIAWEELGGDSKRLSLEKKEIKIPLKRGYTKRIKSPEVKKFIKRHLKDFYYGYKTDVHVNIDNNFVIGIECKAYTENAMIKRILVDFTLVKNVYPNLNCILLQLESQLGGDYSKISNNIIFGSHSTHTLMSYFDVNLIILTLLEGERKVDEPIHKEEFYKELQKNSIINVINVFKDILLKYI